MAAASSGNNSTMRKVMKSTTSMNKSPVKNDGVGTSNRRKKSLRIHLVVPRDGECREPSPTSVTACQSSSAFEKENGGGGEQQQQQQQQQFIISIDAIKADTLATIKRGVDDGKNLREIQKLTHERRDSWKQKLCLPKHEFKLLWNEVKVFCEGEFPQGVEAALNARDNTTKKDTYVDPIASTAATDNVAAMSSHDDGNIRTEIKRRRSENHMPLKKRKLPSDYEATTTFVDRRPGPQKAPVISDKGDTASTGRLSSKKNSATASTSRNSLAHTCSPTFKDVVKSLEKEEEKEGEEKARKKFYFGDWDFYESFSQ